MISGANNSGVYRQLASGLSSYKGLADLYRGSLSELYAAALGGSLLFGVNNILKVGMGVTAIRTEGDKSQPLSVGLIVAAAGTGFFDALVYKPLEVIKLKMQVEMSDKPLTFTSCTRKIIREGGGLRGLYHGLLPTLVRSAVSYFFAYDLLSFRLLFLPCLPLPYLALIRFVAAEKQWVLRPSSQHTR